MFDAFRRKKIFTNIFKQNYWQGESKSGTGSSLEQTVIVRKKLPELMRQFGITSLLDIPCGDFFWMSKVDLTGVQYTGADIVTSLIENNRINYGAANLIFNTLDLISDSLPMRDLVFSRDCLVHLSSKDIFRAVKNIKKSGAKYFLTTTFISRTLNPEIQTGDWRPLNLEIAPFNFPKPLAVIIEECTESEGKFADKALALWRTDSLP